MDYVHVFVLRTLCLDEDGEIKTRNVAVNQAHWGMDSTQ